MRPGLIRYFTDLPRGVVRPGRNADPHLIVRYTIR